MESMLKMINTQDVIIEQGGAKCQKLISNQGGKSAIKVGQKIEKNVSMRLHYSLLKSKSTFHL